MTDLELFDYDLPEELIAAVPAERRECARLLCMERSTGNVSHCGSFTDIVRFFRPGDLLVLNDAQVIRARLSGRRATGGRVEILLVRPACSAGGGREPAARWVARLRSSGRIRAGEELILPEQNLGMRVAEDLGGGNFGIAFDSSAAADSALKAGGMPLPPYILRARRRAGLPEYMPELDRGRYQTVYAKMPGAVAAPTAGLHFTEEILERIRNKGVSVGFLTLLVGPGTFMPVRSKQIERHCVEPEYYHIPAATASAVECTLKEGRRVVAAGTTSVRVLEHIARAGLWKEHSGWADIYIYPPFEFRITGALITNFHLPRSSLLMLVSAFAGRENVLAAYEDAVRLGYRFYSYGDATFIY